MKMKRVTINDIAEATGFSKTTVSFAFNTPDRLPAVTVKKIRDTAREMGYSPDPLARSMTTRKTGTIGLLLPQELQLVCENHLFTDLLRGIGEMLEHDHRSVLLVPPVKGSISEAIAGAVVDGFITWGLEREHSAVSILEQRGIPYVMLDADSFDDVPCVNVDDRNGAYEAMRYVLANGHRRITILAFLNPYGLDYEQYHGTIRERIQGYDDALREVGLTVDSPEIQLEVDMVTRKAGHDLMQRIWSSVDTRPTAIVSMSDTCALGIIEYCHDKGIRVPQDLSVVGFDDVPEAALMNPGLTTVAQSGIDKGREAARILLELLKKTSGNPHVLLNTHLVVRGSVTRAAAAT